MVDPEVVVIELEILLDRVLVPIQLVGERFSDVLPTNGVLLVRAQRNQLIVRHVHEADAAVHVLLLLLRKPRHLEAIRAGRSLLVIEVVDRPVGLPEVVLALFGLLLFFLLLLRLLFLRLGGFLYLLLLLLLAFFRSQDILLDQLVPVLLRSSDGVRLLLQQGQTLILIPDLQVPVDQLEQLSLVLDVEFIVFAKAVHPLERQSHQELARLLIIDDFLDVELNDRLASLEDWLRIELRTHK